MPSEHDRPLPRFAVGDEVLSRDAGPGRVEELVEPLWLTGNSGYWSPWKYRVHLYLHDRSQEYSERFLVGEAKPENVLAVLTPEQVARKRREAILAVMRACDAGFFAVANGYASDVQTDCADYLRQCLNHLSPQDLSLVQGVIRAQETVLAHLESLKEKAR